MHKKTNIQINMKIFSNVYILKNSDCRITIFFTLILNIFPLLNSRDFSIIRDEIGSLASASALAGLDWSGVIQQTKYYGIGFNWIYAPLFRLLNNPYAVWIGIWIINAFLLALLSGLVHYIAHSFFNIKNRTAAITGSVLTGIILGGYKIYNEIGVYFVTWISCYFFIKLIHNQNESIRDTCILSILSGWLLLIHTRTLLWLLVVIFIAFSGKYFFKVKSTNMKIFLPLTAFMYVLSDCIKKYAILSLWRNSSVSTTGFNAFIPVNLKQQWLISQEGIVLCFKIFLSNFLTCVNRTYGFFLLAFVLFTMTLYKKAKNNSDKLKKNKEAFILLLLGILTTSGIIAGIIYLNGPGMYSNLFSGTTIFAKYKAFHFWRYYCPYACLLIFPVIFLDRLNIISKFLILLLYCNASLIYLWKIRPITVGMGFSNYILSITCFDTFNTNYFITIVFISLLLIMLFSGKINICLIIILLYITIPKLEGFTINCTNLTGNGAYELMKKIDDFDINIYCEDSQLASNYQFLLYNHSIQVEIPDFSKDKNILWLTECSKEKNKLITGENIYSVRLDDNETAYIAGQQLKIRMTELGYKLETVE